jgi:hypothetical protein
MHPAYMDTKQREPLAVRLSFMLPRSLAEALERQAIRTDRTVSAEVRAAIRQHLAQGKP